MLPLLLSYALFCTLQASISPNNEAGEATNRASASAAHVEKKINILSSFFTKQPKSKPAVVSAELKLAPDSAAPPEKPGLEIHTVSLQRGRRGFNLRYGTSVPYCKVAVQYIYTGLRPAYLDMYPDIISISI